MQTIVDATLELIKIPSVSSDINELCKVREYIKKQFEKYPEAIISMYDWNKKPSIIIQNFEGKKADIILNGHFDVVPPSDEDQFQPKIIDGKIYGRGAGDMKSGDAIMIDLMREIFENKFTNKKVALILTGDEEVGGFHGAQKIIELGYRATLGVIIPDSGSTDEIVIAEKGLYCISVEVSGKAGHSSRPWLGDNAIIKTYKLYEALKEYIQDDEALYSGDHWSSSVNLNMISGGSTPNMIPDSVEATFDIRITEKFSDTQSFEQNLQAIFEKYDAKILSSFSGDLVYTDPENSFVQTYLGACERVLGKKADITKEHGASDGRFFAAKGMPVILHRPTCENIHSKDEYVEIASMEKIYAIYREMIFNS